MPFILELGTLDNETAFPTEDIAPISTSEEVLAEAVIPVEAEPVTPVEAEAVIPVEAEPVTPVEAEAVIPVEAEAVIPVEAEPVTPVEAEPVESQPASAISPAIKRVNTEAAETRWQLMVATFFGVISTMLFSFFSLLVYALINFTESSLRSLLVQPVGVLLTIVFVLILPIVFGTGIAFFMFQRSAPSATKR
jgi:uncharacterized membrane protein YdbT with pleckstrin-like domain